jgi:hypothetical protein
MTTATLNLGEIAEFWRIARRLHTVYAELDRTFELGMPPCQDLEEPMDRSEPAVLERVRLWFDQIDVHVQVWQLRQLLQSTNLQTEENLRYLIGRHLEKKERTEADKDKIDFLLVQYFAHCAPHGLNEPQITLEEVARVLEPALGKGVERFPDWAPGLDDKLQKLNESNSLEDLQDSGALLEVRELKLSVGNDYFEAGFLVAFTRFNFLARRAFFRAMHLDLHAIRSGVNELERLNVSVVDCRDAGLSDSESVEQIRHVVHQWKTPFRAPYSGGSSFLQLIVLRHDVQKALEKARAEVAPSAVAPDSPGSRTAQVDQARAVVLPPAPPLATVPPAPEVDSSAEAAAGKIEKIQVQTPARATGKEPALAPGAHGAQIVARPVAASAPPPPSAESVQAEQSEEHDYLQNCVEDITEQLRAMPVKHSPTVSAIVLGGCKLLVATWEAQAFFGDDALSKALQRTVAARTILYVCMDRHKKNEATDLTFALELAQAQVEEMKAQVIIAKESKNIDAAVNLAATAKRLLSLIADAEKLVA